MRLWQIALVLGGIGLGACSGSPEGSALPTGVPSGASTVAPSNPGASGSDGGTSPTPIGAEAGTKSDGGPKPPGPGPGTGGTGGPAAGEHDLTIAGKSVALHVPPGASTAPTPVVILLHGQGDTGRNFLNVWLAKGLPSDVLLASPDDNSDDYAMTLEASLRTMFDVDTSREYVLGFSQGGGYAAFLLFDAQRANRFAAIALASSGLAENPAGIPAAGPSSPAIAVVIDPTDPNNTWNQGLHVMEDFVGLVEGKGYTAKLTLHSEGHKLAQSAAQSTLAWMFTQTK